MLDINFADMLIWYVAFLFSVTSHEAAHALAALRGGDPTAYLGGQVTLNPLPHIQRSTVGMVVVPLVSFLFSGGWMIGWASAPYDPSWADRHPRKAAWMAAAGPAANFVIAAAALLIMKIGLAAGSFVAPQLEDLAGGQIFTHLVVSADALWIGVAKLVSVLFILNLILFIFNLFPFPPLDGSSVITLLMSPELTVKFNQFMRQPAFSFLGMVIAWRLFGEVFQPVFRTMFHVIHPELSF